jgi:5-methylcytosine-specific restriction enzyme A
LPSDWNTRRLVVLKRDKGICYICGNEGADAVDHVVASDNHHLDNLKAIHDKVPPHCHRKKSSQEGLEALRGNRVKRRF